MIQDLRVVAVIPARSGSKGLVDKNIRPLCGKPLLAWPIAAARACAYIDCVVLSTDSPVYQHIGLQYGAQVPSLRPAHLAQDHSTSVPVVLHMLDSLSATQHYDIVVLLEPTSPLTEAADIDRALETLVQHWHSSDAVVSVADTASAHPAFCVTLDEQQRLQPLHNFQHSTPRRQDVSPVYYLDGSFYLSKIDALRQLGTFYHSRSLGMPLPDWKAYEIDTLTDFICVEALAKHYLAPQ